MFTPPEIVIILQHFRYSHHQPKGLLRELQVETTAQYDCALARLDHHLLRWPQPDHLDGTCLAANPRPGIFDHALDGTT